jgi:histidyl-tRNA synthetase
MSKPSIPKGTRDFLPEEVLNRRYIFNTIEAIFQKYGYLPIETPVMESLSTLTGKYGEEGDQLLFKVLNNGDYLNKADQEALNNKDSKRLTNSISKRGLRYDLTVPFARYVVMHQNDLSFPFKRYAISPVWRADKPQKGRYQEFYQCDVDVVGSKSLLYEAELVKIYDEVFTALDIAVTIKVNNRKILEGIAEVAGAKDHFAAMAVAIDKLDKIGPDKVTTEMISKFISEEASKTILNSLSLTSLSEVADLLASSDIGMEGVGELKKFHEFLDPIGVSNNIGLDLTLARGLSYYTGCIFEVTADGVQMGSIGGGGRYDDLTSQFGLKDMPGVGISFGAERIYDVMKELGKFDSIPSQGPIAILLSFDEASLYYAFECAHQLRQAGVSVDIYPEAAKFKKQMKYANARDFKYALIIGDQEVSDQTLSIKNLQSGDQQSLSVTQTIELLKS